MAGDSLTSSEAGLPEEHQKVPIRALIGLGFAVLVATGGAASSLILLPRIQSGLDVGADFAAFTLSIGGLAGGIFGPFLARLGAVRQRRYLIVSLVLLTLGSLLSAVATSFGVLVAGRILAGGFAGVLALGIALMRRLSPPSRAGSTTGLLYGLAGLGLGLGILGGSLVADATEGFAAVFLAGAILSILGTVAVLLLVPRGSEEALSEARAPTDIAGTLLLSAWLTAALTAGTLSASLPGPVVVAAIITVPVAFVLWVRTARRAVAPVVDFGLLFSRRLFPLMTLGLLSGFALNLALLGVTYLAQTPEFARSGAIDSLVPTNYGLGLSVTSSALVALPAAVLMMLLSGLPGILARRLGTRSLLAAGQLVLAVGFAALALQHNSVGALLGGSTLIGVGLGVTAGTVALLMANRLAIHDMAIGTGLNNLMTTVGSAASGGVLGAALAATTIASTEVPRESAFVQVFWIGAAVCIGGSVLAGAMRHSKSDRGGVLG